MVAGGELAMNDGQGAESSSPKWRITSCLRCMILVGLVSYVACACKVKTAMPQTILSFDVGLWVSRYNYFYNPHVLEHCGFADPARNTSAVAMVALAWEELGTAKAKTMIGFNILLYFLAALPFLSLFPSLFFLP